MNRKILFGIVALAVIVVGAAVWLMWPQEGEDLYLGGQTALYGWATKQKVRLNIINRGGTTAELYAVGIGGGGQNYTFYEDVVIPAGVECFVEFSMWGGPVNVTTISGSPPAEGGEFASPNWSGNLTSAGA